ncbi:MAG: hypothetical protein JO314_03230 [Acidobacteria bacterium]|nr:hypothetical protein [Acidobacteriota bacterium]
MTLVVGRTKIVCRQVLIGDDLRLQGPTQVRAEQTCPAPASPPAIKIEK